MLIYYKGIDLLHINHNTQFQQFIEKVVKSRLIVIHNNKLRKLLIFSDILRISL
jgi:hypothetical protein